MVICLNRRESQPNPLHLILREAFLGPIIKLRRSRTLMCRHGLRVFQRAAVSKIGGDPGRPKTVVADRRHDAGGFGSPPHHAPGVRLIHRLLGQHRRAMSLRRAEQPALLVVGDACRRDISVKRLGRGVMTGHGVLLAALLVQAQHPRRAARPEILDLHCQCSGDARIAIGEGGDQRSVAQVAHSLGWDAVDQPPPFVALQHRRLARLDDVLGAADRGGRVVRHHLADHQPVEQHADGSELLLHTRGRRAGLQCLDVGAHVVRPYLRQRQAALLAPRQKTSARACIGAARVRIADIGGEEFDVTPRCLLGPVTS